MSVIRIGEMIQPAWVRAASVFSESSSNFPVNLRRFIDKTVVASAAAMNVLPALLTPAAVIALVLGLWRVSADLGWAGEFLIAKGFFSHWQVWIALAAGLQIGAAPLAAKINAHDKISEEN